MKIRLDTEKKTIQVEASVNVGELMKSLKKILPNGEWKEFELEPKVIDNNTTWLNPIYIERSPNYYPWYVNTTENVTMDNVPDNYTFTGGDANINLCNASNCAAEETIFNIET
jgi:hypothetical protein